MRRFAPLVPLTACLSCIGGGVSDHAVLMDFGIRSPPIALSRITSDLHVRIFPKADLACHADQGQIFRGDSRVTGAFGGRDVRPDVRCGTSWTAQQATFGLAQPTDLCVPVSGAARVDVSIAA